MKSQNLKLICLGLTLLVSAPALAQPSGQDRGGGDLCENQIKLIREDLKSWINNGGHKALALPGSVSTDQYAVAMLQEIQRAQIACVSKGGPGFPVTVDGRPKVCRFDRSPQSSLITCDFDKFTHLPESQQFTLIHHEYAGLAKVELPRGADSDYSVSNQISYYLENRVVKRLVVKPAPLKMDSIEPTNESFQDAPGYTMDVTLVHGENNIIGCVEALFERALKNTEYSDVQINSSTIYQNLTSLARKLYFEGTRFYFSAQDLNGNTMRGHIDVVVKNLLHTDLRSGQTTSLHATRCYRAGHEKITAAYNNTFSLGGGLWDPYGRQLWESGFVLKSVEGTILHRGTPNRNLDSLDVCRDMNFWPNPNCVDLRSKKE